jgi:organic radical activating enzyme
MHHLNYAEFHITHVCNLNCKNCNRFSNYAFAGHQKWSDYADMYAQWADILNISHIGILGGEPTLNPSFIDWVIGVADLWPNSTITITTNGTQLSRWPDFYKILNTYNGRISIEFNGHGYISRQKFVEYIENFLQPPFIKTIIDTDGDNKIWKTAYNNVKSLSWPDCDSPAQFYDLPEYIQTECHDIHHVSPTIWQDELYGIQYQDTNNVTVKFFLSDSFTTAALRLDQMSGKLTLHKSDPIKSMAACFWKSCHQFMRGKLYKCGPVGILPDFIKQFAVDITEDEKKLINSYTPASHDWQSNDIEKFVQDLKDAVPIDQCTFCPETFVPEKFQSTMKKTKIVKIHDKRKRNKSL